jgi:hypothetical protein
MPPPSTRVRLKGYVSIKTVAGGLFLDPSGDITAQIAAIPPGSLMTVGSAQKLTVDQNRAENGQYHSFITNPSRPELAAKPTETYPGIITYKVMLERVDLYDANLFEAFKIVGKNVVGQNNPFILFVDQFTPPVTIQNSPTGDPNKPFSPRTLGETQRIIIPGVWFNNLPSVFDISDTNQIFVASVEGVALDVIS